MKGFDFSFVAYPPLPDIAALSFSGSMFGGDDEQSQAPAEPLQSFFSLADHTRAAIISPPRTKASNTIDAKGKRTAETSGTFGGLNPEEKIRLQEQLASGRVSKAIEIKKPTPQPRAALSVPTLPLHSLTLTPIASPTKPRLSTSTTTTPPSTTPPSAYHTPVDTPPLSSPSSPPSPLYEATDAEEKKPSLSTDSGPPSFDVQPVLDSLASAFPSAALVFTTPSSAPQHDSATWSPLSATPSAWSDRSLPFSPPTSPPSIKSVGESLNDGLRAIIPTEATKTAPVVAWGGETAMPASPAPSTSGANLPPAQGLAASSEDYEQSEEADGGEALKQGADQEPAAKRLRVGKANVASSAPSSPSKSFLHADFGSSPSSPTISHPPRGSSRTSFSTASSSSVGEIVRSDALVASISAVVPSPSSLARLPFVTFNSPRTHVSPTSNYATQAYGPSLPPTYFPPQQTPFLPDPFNPFQPYPPLLPPGVDPLTLSRLLQEAQAKNGVLQHKLDKYIRKHQEDGKKIAQQADELERLVAEGTGAKRRIKGAELSRGRGVGGGLGSSREKERERVAERRAESAEREVRELKKKVEEEKRGMREWAGHFKERLERQVEEKRERLTDEFGRRKGELERIGRGEVGGSREVNLRAELEEERGQNERVRRERRRSEGNAAELESVRAELAIKNADFKQLQTLHADDQRQLQLLCQSTLQLDANKLAAVKKEGDYHLSLRGEAVSDVVRFEDALFDATANSRSLLQTLDLVISTTSSSYNLAQQVLTRADYRVESTTQAYTDFKARVVPLLRQQEERCTTLEDVEEERKRLQGEAEAKSVTLERLEKEKAELEGLLSQKVRGEGELKTAKERMDVEVGSLKQELSKREQSYLTLETNFRETVKNLDAVLREEDTRVREIKAVHAEAEELRAANISFGREVEAMRRELEESKKKPNSGVSRFLAASPSSTRSSQAG
ncbi:hypothetical protein JCM11641_007025 [Rhodosporidiobolus odoratus]